jgi:hypothetical protein
VLGNFIRQLPDKHYAEDRFLRNCGHLDVYATFAYFGVGLEGRRAIKRRRSHNSTSQALTVCCAFWMAS